MSSELQKITRENIFDAVTKIEREKISLNHSIRYNVLINDEEYPPKEIIRISYKIATGEEVGNIYGGEQVNSILRNLGFTITVKNSIWKLGCNWGKGSPSFFNLLTKNNLVIGTTDRIYKINDLILITEGFTVVALGKILEIPKPVTQEPNLENDFINHSIPFNHNILISKAEIHVLNKNDIFLYQLQQGIVHVRNKTIIEKAINIWDNHKKSNFKSIHILFKRVS